MEHLLRGEIEKLAAAYPTYGYRRITQLLVQQGYRVGYRRVARLMKSENLCVSVKRVCRTTTSLPTLRPYVNRLETLEISRRDQVWVGDITYVRPQQTLHLCRRAHGCLHAYDQGVASESAFDAISDVATATRSIARKRRRDSPFRSRRAISFKCLYLGAQRTRY